MPSGYLLHDYTLWFNYTAINTTLCALRWMDGTPVGIQRWEENQPSTDNFNSICVTMNYYMGELSKPIKQSVNPRWDVLDHYAAGEMFLIVRPMFNQVTGRLVTAAKSTSSFANEEAQLLSTPLLPPKFLQKVVALSSGKNSTQR